MFLEENEKFTVSADFLIINEVYLSSKNMKYELNKENGFYFEEKLKEKKYKLTYYFIFEAPEDSKRVEGPNFYIIPPKNPLYQNESCIIVNEFCQNSYSSPKNRFLFKIDIFSSFVDLEYLKKVFNIFVENHLKDNLTYLLIYQNAFSQEISVNEYIFNHDKNCILTRNNYDNFDLDFYYVRII